MLMIMMNTLLLCSFSLQNWGIIITILATIFGLFKAISEYDEHKRSSSIKFLLDFGKKYTENEDIVEVVKFLEKLEDDNQYMKEYMNENDNTYKDEALDIHKIEMFMRFIEELELLIRGDSISESATLYLFGYYTTILEKYHGRWPKLKYNEKYWNIYRDFVKKANKFDYTNVHI